MSMCRCIVCDTGVAMTHNMWPVLSRLGGCTEADLNHTWQPNGIGRSLGLEFFRGVTCRHCQRDALVLKEDFKKQFDPTKTRIQELEARIAWLSQAGDDI
jgi:hypothetical protein